MLNHAPPRRSDTEDMRAPTQHGELIFCAPSGAVDACTNLGPSDLPDDNRCSMPGGGTEAAVVGSIGAVLGRFAAEAATPVRISCALLYWSVLREITTVGSLYSR